MSNNLIRLPLQLLKNKHWSSCFVFILAMIMYANIFAQMPTMPLKLGTILCLGLFVSLFFKLYEDKQEALIRNSYNKELISFWVFRLGYGLLSVFFIIQWMLVLSNYLRFLTYIPPLAKAILPQLILSSLAMVLLIFFFIQAIKKKVINIFNTAIICAFWLSAYTLISIKVIMESGWLFWLKISTILPVLCCMILIICMEIYSLVALHRLEKA